MDKQENKNKILGGGEPNLRSKFGAKEFYFCFFVCLILLSGSAAAAVKLETGLPNIPEGGLQTGQELPSYINYLFIFGLGAITILALAQMMLGGIQYLLAAGNVSKTEDAKNTIQQALLGLGILLASFLLLRTINPDLVNLKNPTLVPLEFTGKQCVKWNAEGLQTCMDQNGMSFEECKRASCIRFEGEPTGPEEPPVSGIPSELTYSVMLPMACDSVGGQIFRPCKTYCLTTPGLCSASSICCGKKP